jgi:hypothetical protein
MKGSWLNIGFILFLFISCVKTEPVSIIPEITFKSLNLYQSYDSTKGVGTYNALLKFEFIDGDADIGLSSSIASDTSLPDTIRYNIFLFPYEKIKGSYYAIVPDTSLHLPPPYYRITDDDKMTRSGQNKTLKGEITINMVDLPIGYDTIRYEFFIKDAAGHKSNLQITNDIGF